ncbi:3-oxoacyl-[acyl-carrier-protein] synthase [Tulasnella sp. 427]|nr:3-oxoacyl-[acyl-carrier-protein] synthase [Tulasnella sp. 427]
MQTVVERLSQNRSNCATCTGNSSRISPSFNTVALREVVENISRRTETLLEIVNFKVRGQEYACANELASLQTLTDDVKFLKKQKIDIGKLTQAMFVEKVKEMLTDIVDDCRKKLSSRSRRPRLDQARTWLCHYPLARHRHLIPRKSIFKFERLIEIGPSPTLTGMATRTLKAKYEAQAAMSVSFALSSARPRHAKEIHHQFKDEPEGSACRDLPPPNFPLVQLPQSLPQSQLLLHRRLAGAVTIPRDPVKVTDTLPALPSSGFSSRSSTSRQ